ncbi:MAG: peptidoglycan DD-metalloendopeptidase family protein [Ardenticatenia bacterium]|nr:peptidoglycan DD-metalloendopeptidase family protein [Ardenticatenia bacterium]
MDRRDDALTVTLVAVLLVVLGLWAGVLAGKAGLGQPLLSGGQAVMPEEGGALALQMASARQDGGQTEIEMLPDPVVSPTPTATPTQTPVPTATPSPSPSPTPMPMPTPTSMPTPSPRPGAAGVQAFPSSDVAHFWLERPIGDGGVNTIARFYPYASTGEGMYPVHHGVEFVNPEGTPVLAVAPGRVIFAGRDVEEAVGPRTDFYGLVVVQELDQRWRGRPVYIVYGHMSAVNVEVGQRVAPGDRVGLVGMTGVAIGPHLHLEVRVGGRTYDDVRNPELWLKPLPGRGVIVGRVLDEAGQPVDEALVTLQDPADGDLLLYTYSYAGREVLPDGGWQENVVIGDVPAGTWRLAARVNGRTLVQDVTVRDGEATFVIVQPTGDLGAHGE